MPKLVATIRRDVQIAILKLADGDCCNEHYDWESVIQVVLGEVDGWRADEQLRKYWVDTVDGEEVSKILHDLYNDQYIASKVSGEHAQDYQAGWVYITDSGFDKLQALELGCRTDSRATPTEVASQIIKIDFMKDYDPNQHAICQKILRVCMADGYDGSGSIYHWDTVVDIITGNTDGSREQRYWDQFMVSKSDPEVVDRVIKDLVDRGFINSSDRYNPQEAKGYLQANESGHRLLKKLENAPKKVAEKKYQEKAAVKAHKIAKKKQAAKHPKPGQAWNWWVKG